MIDFPFLADTMLKLLAALPTTLTLFFGSLVIGLTLSVGIVSLRVSRWWFFSYPARFYIMLFRGTPLLIQMFLIYYGLGQFPAIRDSFAWVLLRSPYGCAVVSLALCTAGYTAEIIRGGLLSVPQGQIEAGKAVGMSPWDLLRRIIAPVTLRQALPAYSTEAIAGQVYGAGQPGDCLGRHWRRATDHPAHLSHDGSFHLCGLDLPGAEFPGRACCRLARVSPLAALA